MINEKTLIPPQAQGRNVSELRYGIATRKYALKQNNDTIEECYIGDTVKVYFDFENEPTGAVIVNKEDDIFCLITFEENDIVYALKKELFI